MEEMFTPMYGNVFTVFDYIALLIGGAGNLFQGLLGGLGSLLGGILPF